MFGVTDDYAKIQMNGILISLYMGFLIKDNLADIIVPDIDLSVLG